MPVSFDELFGPSAAPTMPKAVSFDELFGAPNIENPPENNSYAKLRSPHGDDWQSLQLAREQELSTGIPSEDNRDALQALYEQETDAERKSHALVDWQVEQKRYDAASQSIADSIASMQEKGLDPASQYQDELYETAMSTPGGRLANNPIARGIMQGATTVVSVPAELAMRSLPNHTESGQGLSEVADFLAESRASDDAFSAAAERTEGPVGSMAESAVEMLTKYVPQAMGGTILPFIYAESQSSAYNEGAKSGLSGAKLDAYANSLGLLNAAATYIGGKVAGKIGAKTFEEFAAGTPAIPKSIGEAAKSFLKGGSVETAIEEVPTYLGEGLARYLAGIAEGPVPDTWHKDLREITALSFIMQGVASGSDAHTAFIADPSPQNAKAAGIPPSVARNTQERQNLAEKARQQLAESASAEAPVSEAPSSPVDATEQIVAPESGLVVPTQPDASGEASAPLETALPVQPSTESVAIGTPPPPVAVSYREAPPVAETRQNSAPPANESKGNASGYANRKLKPGDNYPSAAQSWIGGTVARVPNDIKGAAGVADSIRKQWDDKYYWSYLQKSGQTLEEAVQQVYDSLKPKATPIDTAEAPSVAPPADPATVLDTASAVGVGPQLHESHSSLGYNLKDSAPLTADAFRQQLSVAATSPEEADAIYGIFEARAESAGESIDDYLGSRLKGVERGLMAEATTVKQGNARKPRGEVEFLKDGRAVIRAFEGQNLSTLAHESGHVFRRDLKDIDLKAAEKWAGVKNGKWNRAAEEKFARGFERYLIEGKAPTPKLKQVFEQFKEWLSQVYRRLKGSPIDLKITPEMAAVYDRLFLPPVDSLRSETAPASEPDREQFSVIDDADTSNPPPISENTPEREQSPLVQQTFFQGDQSSPTSIKNAKVDEERIARGLEPLMTVSRLSDQRAWDEAMRKMDREPNWQRDLATSLAVDPRAPSKLESAALLHMRVTLRNEYHDALDAWDRANESGDIEAAGEAEQRVTAAAARMDDFDQMDRAVGTESGRSLQARKMMADEDYSLVRMELETRQAKGRALTEDERAKVRELQEKIAQLESQLATTQAEVESANEAKSLDEAVNEARKPTSRPRNVTPDQERDTIVGKIKAKVEKDETSSITPFVQRLAKYFWGQGVREREPMIDALHGVLSGLIPDWTREQTQRAFSGYGDFRPLSKGEVEVGLRDLKGQTQQVLKIEALENRKPLEKTGVERRAPTDEERRLAKIVNDLKRRYGVVVTDPESQLKSALDARKTYYRNRMSDLKFEIEQRQKIVKQRSDTPTDPELDEMLKEYEQIKSDHESIFGKPELTDEQRLRLATQAAERAEKAWAERLENAKKGVFDAHKKVRRPVSSDELKAIKARVDLVKQQVKEMETLSKPKKSAEEIALQSLKTRMLSETTKLWDKWLAGDFSVKERKPIVLDAKAAELKADLDIARMEFRRGLEKERWKRASLFEKGKKVASGTWDLGRLIMTTGEMSFLLRQGKLRAISHPAQTAKAMGQAFRALKSDRSALAIDKQIASHPRYAEAKQAKLHLSDSTSPLSKQEESIMGDWVGRIPVAKAFSRSARVFMNKLRFDAYLAATKGMTKSGTGTPEERRQIAMMINEFTGRGGLSKIGEPAAVALGRVLFSPRYLASRLQVATGHSLWGGTMRTRRVVAGEYARAIAGMGLYYAMLSALLQGEDDEVIELDPRSSDFGKVRIGDTRLDPLAGLAQVVTFASRLYTGETKTTGAGKVVPLRGPDKPFNGSDVPDVMMRFARSKAHPAIGTAVNLLAGTDIVGEQVTLGGESSRMAGPITWWDMKEAMENHGLGEGSAISLLAFFGEGINNYSAGDPAKRAESYSKQAILQHGHPEKQADESDSEYESRVEMWKKDRQFATEWLRENKDKPEVQKALKAILNSKSYRGALDSGSPPSPRPNDRAGAYQKRRQSYQLQKERASGARRVAGELGG